MSIRNGRERLQAVLLLVCLIAATHVCPNDARARDVRAQSAPACQFVSFKVHLNAGDNFERELGGGLLFRVRSQKDSSWFLDIVPAEENTKDYIYPVNLPLRFNGNQTFGPGFGETVKSSLAHPHEMYFLLNRRDYDRVFSLIGNVLRSYQTSDPDKALADYTNAIDDANKGWLRVTISSYKTDSKGALTRIKLRVEFTTPPDFQFAPHLNPFPWPCHP
ncbi:MAG TPA: hypothetical protein VJX47_12500 [Candidatus Sulfotelmatobacter sp.]|nr:hypothetical protein [Candidatus Sulfotelmatobacter sp.]